MSYPRFSIIIPVKPGGEVKALESVQKVDFPVEHVEILVVEGRAPSRQRNVGVREAQGEIVCFLDDDSLVTTDYLARLAAHYEDGTVAAVGGPSLTPDSDSLLQRVFGQAFASLVGGGGVRNRYRKVGTVRACRDNELILCNLSFRRDILLAYGGFDERLYPNEENELMDRLVRDGQRLIHDPDLAVIRSQRASWRAFVRQLFGYGQGRGEQTRLAGISTLIPFLPLFFLVYLLGIPILGGIAWVPLLVYGVAVSVTAVMGSINMHNIGGALLLLALPLMHSAYGIGLLVGLVAPRFRGSSPDNVEAVRRIKGISPVQ
jgi:glycosyltransferase involved in cell wall biosynthesis